MPVLRITRFEVEPAEVDEMLRRRSALLDAVRESCPGLTGTQVSRLDPRHWVDIWRWASSQEMAAALQAAASGRLPAAGPAFALTQNATAEVMEVVDER